MFIQELASEELNAVRDSTRRLLAEKLQPKISEYEQNAHFERSLCTEMGKLGLLAPMLPEPYGQGDLFAQYIIAEEMGYVCSGFGLSALASVCLFGANVGNHGSDAQKQKYLPGIASGDKIGCWALTEPAHGSDALGIETRCHREGDSFIINGSKTFITNAPIADYFIVIARETDSKGKPLQQGMAGGIAFILERGTKGLTTGAPLHKMGHLSSPTGEIFMDDVRVDAKQVLGTPGKAFTDMKYSLDVERVIFSALGIGLMRFCLDTTVQYTLTRKQFGKAVADFQMTKDKLARMGTLRDTAACFLETVLQRLAAGKNVTKDAAMAKLYLSSSAVETADLAVQCHGGYGYMQEYQVERCLRDAKLFEIGAGTSEIQKLIIAHEILAEADA